MKRLITGLVGMTIVVCMGCFGGKDVPDISNIQVDIDPVHYDDLFLAMTPDESLEAQIGALANDYPNLTKIYIDNVMQFRPRRDTTNLYLTDVKGFLSSDVVKKLKSQIDSVFVDRNIINQGFEEAFQYFKYYFPYIPTPRLYYLITEYSYATFIFPESEERDGLAISLDMFMGRDYPYKALFPTNAAFSAYITNTFDKAYIVKKGMDAVIDDLVGVPNGQRMIDQMIHNGKKQYILEQFLPMTPDSIRWEFTADQMEWVKDNELNLYSHFTSQKMLYETDQMKFLKFVAPSPNSPGLPPEAPGRTGNFIGYKIVEAFMDKTNASLEELIEMNDAQTIVNQARYRPAI